MQWDSGQIKAAPDIGSWTFQVEIEKVHQPETGAESGEKKVGPAIYIWGNGRGLLGWAENLLTVFLKKEKGREKKK